jgi:hypothetical protein
MGLSPFRSPFSDSSHATNTGGAYLQGRKGRGRSRSAEALAP